MGKYKLVEVTREEYVALGLAGAWVYAAHGKPVIAVSTAPSDAEEFVDFQKFASDEYYSFDAFYTRTLDEE